MEGVLSHVRKTRPAKRCCPSLPSEVFNDLLISTVRFDAPQLSTLPSIKPRSHEVRTSASPACVSQCDGRYASSPSHFYANMVRVLPFTPLKVFSFISWKNNDLRSQVVQEGSGVRGADNAARVGFEPILKPPEVIPVTRGLIRHDHNAAHQLSRAPASSVLCTCVKSSTP